MQYKLPFFIALTLIFRTFNCQATVAAVSTATTAQTVVTTQKAEEKPTETTAEKPKKSYIQQVTYGGDKGASIFTIRSEHAIQWAVKQFSAIIERSKKEKKSIHSYYTEFLGEKETGLAKFRRDIAFETSTSSKEAFGALRTNDTPHLLDYTPIRKSWHDDVSEYFVKLMTHLDRTDTDHIVHLNSPRAQNNLYVIQQDYCLDDRNIPLSRDLLINHYKHNPAELTDDAVSKIAQHESVSMDELFFGPPNGDIKRDLRILQRSKDALRIIKYEVKIKIDDKMVPASVIYGYFQADTKKANGITKESMEKLSKKSHFIVMHAAKEFVPTLMMAVEKYWEKALLRDSKDVEGIKEDMANIFYIQTHAMPYSRGSEAMTKWILEAIARFHGWTVVYPSEYGFQDPFQLTIDDFILEFNHKVKIAPYIAKKAEEIAETTAPVTTITAAVTPTTVAITTTVTPTISAAVPPTMVPAA